MKKLLNPIRRKWRRYKNRPRLQHPHITVRVGSLKVGEGSVLGKVKVDLTGDVTVGRNCILSRGARIVTHRHLFLEGEVPDITEEKRIVACSLTIGNNVYVGEDAMILPQVESIGDNSIIGARAVLTKRVGPGEIWVGNPARMVGRRGQQSGDCG